jgi:hypothetical protein
MKLIDDKLFSARCTVIPLLAFCILSFSGCTSDKKITEPEVQELIVRLDVAAKKLDADAITANMSENVKIDVKVTSQGRTEALTFNRDQYKDFMKKSFAVGTDYTYLRQKTQITVDSDGKSAIMSDEVAESITVNKQVIHSTGTEVATIGREHGQLVIQYLAATGNQF